MFISNMKILTLNSQQNVSLSSPPIVNQQQLSEQDGGCGGGSGGGGGSSKDFINNRGGGSIQKSSKRDPHHQKHNNSGPNNNSKFMHSHNNKVQSSQQHQQQQKYNNSSSNSKNKKQHYNSNSNSTSSALNRKRYYQQQQQQNALQQLQHCHQQQQYISAIRPNQQKTQPTTTPVSHTTFKNHNNNSHLIKNQNYTNLDLLQNPTGQITTAANTVISVPQKTVTSTTTITETCNCSILPKNDCNKLSSSTESQHHQQFQSCIPYDTQHRSTTSLALAIQNGNNSTHVLPQAASVTPCCRCCSILIKVPQTTVVGNIKASKNKKSFSAENNSTNLEDFVDATDAPNSHSTTTLPSSNSKKKSNWKSCNIVDGVGEGTCSSPKVSNDNELVADTKRCDCNTKITGDSVKNQEKLLQKEAMSHTSNNSSTGDVSRILSTDNSSITFTASKQKSTNATLNIEKPQQQSNEIIGSSKQVATKSVANNIDSKLTTCVADTTTPVHSSVSNSYSLDFLHSVGVQMTGGVKLDMTRGTENNVRIITGITPYASQGSENSPARCSYPYSGVNMNQRQQRYVFGGGNGSTHHTYHHYPQPTQLTIASFMQKDTLGESLLSSTCSTNSSSNSGVRNSNGGSNNINDQQSNHQQNYTRSHQHSRYYNNYYQTPHYHQHAPQQTLGHQHSYDYGSSGTVGGELPRIASNVGNQRPGYNGYLNYHSGANNTIPYHMQSIQEQARSRVSQSNDSGNSTHRKSSHGSCSSASSCSSSSSASASSISSGGSHRKHTPASAQSQHKPPLSNLNLAIETLPSKSNSHHHGTQKQNHHHRGHHYSYQGHGHHNHQHHQHALANTPTTPVHQNYHNLTYVSTDGRNGVSTNGSTCGTNSRGSSPTPQSLPPTPSSTSNHSPKSLETGSDPAAILANLQLSGPGQLNYPGFIQNQQSTSQQFQHYQQQQFLNKKLLAPLSLSMPSPSPSPTPSHIGGTLAPQQQPLGPHNIICCSQLDEASTAAAAAAAKTGIIAGNDYDSDSSSVSNTAQHRKYRPLKSLSISSTSSSATSLCPTAQPLQDCPSQPGTPADVSTSTTPLCSPLNYATSTHQSFPSIQSASAPHPQQFLNQTQVAYKTAPNVTATATTQLPHIYRNGVVSLLNLPNQSPNNCEAACVNYLEEDYQQQRQQPHFYLTSSAQSSADQLSVISGLSVATSRSNSSSGYWSPSHQCNFLYHQLSSSGPTLVAPNTPSCASPSSSISPSLPDRGDEVRQLQLHKQFPSSGSSSPSTCSPCLNEHHGVAEGCNSTNGSSSNSSVSGRGSGYVTTSDTGSTQLLAPQQQRLIAQQSQQTCSSSLAMSNSAGSTQSGVQRPRSAGTNRNQQYVSNHAVLTSTTATSTGSSTQHQMHPHIFSHQHLQSLPPPPPPHNLLYSNPQAHHLRALNNSSAHDFFTHTPPDRFLARAHLIEAKEVPTTLLNNSKWDNLSQDIWKKFISSQQTEDTFKQKMRLWRYLYLFIKNAYPRYGLYLVGSTISGFGSDTSDVDMCLVSRSASNIDPRMEALFNLTVLRDCLSKSGEFEYFNLIEAKVPILRFRDRVHQLEVDLNFNNCVGIKNTHLLHCYSQLDWRLRPLVLVTKLWAQHHNINNAKNMTISSYSLVLMVIHFLQYAVNPPVLPCLHNMFPDKFPLLRSNDFGYVDMNETIGPYDSKNNQSIGELFLNFLEYYSLFDYSQHAISVRTGGILPINVCRTAKSLKNDVHQWKELCIEEPFDLTNTARSVYDYETFERVKTVIVSSWHALQGTMNLNSLFLPFIDTSIPPPQQTPTSGTAASKSVVHISGGFNHKLATTKCSTGNCSLLSTENPRVDLNSSDNNGHSSTKQGTKYRDSKHILTYCHKEIQFEEKSTGVKDASNFTSSVVISGSTPSTSCN